MFNFHIDQQGESPDTQLIPNTPLTQHDQCMVTIEGAQGEHDQARLQVSTSSSGVELVSKIPPLPRHKDKYVFISHSSEDFERVMEIVNELEERFHVSCIIANRDFQPGKRIIENIKDSMERSLKTVFMLTPNFVKSGFCTFEQNIAFLSSIESGINNVIPVLLKECDIPTSLATITYVDGTLPGVDIPAKIAQALTQTELAEGILPSECQALSKKYENGYCFRIHYKKLRVWCGIKPSEYIFDLNNDELSRLQRAKMNDIRSDDFLHDVDGIAHIAGPLPTEVVNEAITVVNNSKLVIPNECYLKTLGHQAAALCVVVGFVLLLSFGVPRRSLSIYVSPLMGVSITVAVVITVVVLKHLDRIYRRYVKLPKTLNLALWGAVGETLIQHNAIVFVLIPEARPPSLSFMRFDVTACKMYLAGLIRSRERGRTEQSTSPESRADRMIRNGITQWMTMLTPGLEKIPEAPYIRHPVRKSKMCLCQTLELNILNRN